MIIMFSWICQELKNWEKGKKVVMLGNEAMNRGALEAIIFTP